MKLSQDLLEKLFVLLVTAALTGFLVPYVLKRIDETRALEQKRSEAEVARQTKVIESQSALLDEVTETLWRWRYLSMKVAFNGRERRDEEYAVSAKEYETGIWDVLNKLRNQASKSRRLVSEKGYKSLIALYDQIAELDSRLDLIVRQTLPSKERSEALTPIHAELRSEMTVRLDDTLNLLAIEVGLKHSAVVALEKQ